VLDSDVTEPLLILLWTTSALILRRPLADRPRYLWHSTHSPAHLLPVRRGPRTNEHSDRATNGPFLMYIANLDAGQIYIPLLTGDATILTPFMIPHILCAEAI